ncbi:MAG: hypothetical protein JSR17_12755 [Proteobacteria bacterium]|nr:hypothetical protein [Pseudomonadota bacterium]
MPRLVFDLGELWQDTKDILKLTYLFWTDPKEAPPVMRKIDAAFVPLLDAQDNIVGTFVPEFYEIARVANKSHGLQAQQEEALWEQQNPRGTDAQRRQQPFYNKLYRADGTPKTAFELAVLPVAYSDFNRRSTLAVQKRIQDEFNYRIAKGQLLPPVVNKYQIVSDYLQNLGAIGLHAGGQRDVTLNINNPAIETTLIDRFTHYSAQRGALLLTILAVLGLTYTTPLAFAASALGVVLAKWCSEEFTTFGLGEVMLRDLRSIFSKDYLMGDKISAKKVLKTGVLLTALGIATIGAFWGAWAGTLGLGLWTTASAALNGTALTALQYGFAGFASAVAASCTFAFGAGAQRFFWGLGIWHKQIDFTNVPANAFAALGKDGPAPKPSLTSKLAHWQEKFNELAQALPEKQRDAVLQAGNQFTQLRDAVSQATAQEAKAKARSVASRKKRAAAH